MIKNKIILTQDSKKTDKDLNGCIEFSGIKKWYQNGNLHRDNDLPAREKTNGDKEWYQKGVLHRDNGLPTVIENNGKDFWWYSKSKKID